MRLADAGAEPPTQESVLFEIVSRPCCGTVWLPLGDHFGIIVRQMLGLCWDYFDIILAAFTITLS